MISKPGVYQINERDYHSDPCPEPSLSCSIAKILWAKSPKHAWFAHPKLNPDFEQVNKRVFDLGSAAHAVLLENKRSDIVIIQYDDYRKKAAQEERNEAYDNGKMPLLAHEYENVNQMVEVAKATIKESEIPNVLDTGKPEQTLIAKHKGIWLRSRLDWMTEDRLTILDYKTTGGSAQPESWVRNNMFLLSYDIQCVFYPFINELTEGPRDCDFFFLVQENTPPFVCSVIGAAPSAIESGQRKMDIAIDTWAKCLKENRWPGYGERIAYAEAPSWVMTETAERELLYYGEHSL